MKIQLYFIFVILLLLSPCKLYSENNKKPFVIPELREWTGGKGVFIPKETSRIVYIGDETDWQCIANQFAEDYEIMFGRHMEVVKDHPKVGDFVLTTSSDRHLKEEGYILKITDKVILSAYNSKGLYWGTRTLLQLSEQKNLALPKGKVRDYPDYEIRGFMLDCGRKFIPISFLRDYVKMMAYYKMNTFQIHLNDDTDFTTMDDLYTAFRLENETFPGLTARDGFYTKKEFQALQRLADSVKVNIIPEIDVPAHSYSFTKYKPEIGSKKYGRDHLDLFSPETYEFVDALFKEYLEGDNPVFLGKQVHIGTDEYSNKDQNVVEKFRFFTDHYIYFVEKYGKQACVWGSLTHAKGETAVKSDNVLMWLWNNRYADPKAMIEDGYDVVSIPDSYVYIVPTADYYHDYLDTEWLYKEWTPAYFRDQKFPEKHPQIKGGMFALWNDFANNGISTKDIHYRVFPAMQTLSVKMWNGAACTVPYDSFKSSRLMLSDAPGVNVAGRIGLEPQVVYSLDNVKPGMTTGLREIGYHYTVSFDIKAVKEEKGTVLFSSPDALFYLSDPISGKLGFSRDGYLNTFNYQFYPGETVSVAIEGDETATRLYVNGELVENLNIQKHYFKGGKKSMNYVRTLVFPLEKAGRFSGLIRNMKVFNYCKSVE